MSEGQTTEAIEQATWRVGLWLDNDEGLYHASREIVRNAVPKDAENMLRLLVRDAHLSDCGPGTLRRCDWAEIVHDIQEEALAE